MNAHAMKGLQPMEPATLALIMRDARAVAPTLTGPLPVYHEHATNHCPGCTRTHWHIGRTTAECAFCGTALPLAAAMHKQDAALERPRLVHGRAAPRFHELRLAARSTPERRAQ